MTIPQFLGWFLLLTPIVGGTVVYVHHKRAWGFLLRVAVWTTYFTFAIWLIA